MTLLCITNEVDDLRSCTIRNEHLSTCENDARTGCLPRPAQQGLLCYSCATKLDDALTLSVDLISHCRSIESGPRDTSGVRTAPGSQVILPTSWIQADTLYRSLAAEAVRYVHAVQTALHAFPLEEKPRRIRHIRCRTCQHESLQWRPPLEHLDPIVIQCSNPGCGALWDPQMVDFDMRVLREEIEAELLGRKDKAA